MADGDTSKYDSEASRALVNAAFVCDVAHVRELLRHGANPNARDEDGRTPMFSAVLGNSMELLELLLSAGADVNARDRDDWTVLHYAAQEFLPKVASVLLNAGADVEARDADGNTPLWRAVFSANGRGGMVALLIAHGAKPDTPNAAGESARDLAVRLDDAELLALFKSPTILLQQKKDLH